MDGPSLFRNVNTCTADHDRVGAGSFSVVESKRRMMQSLGLYSSSRCFQAYVKPRPGRRCQCLQHVRAASDDAACTSGSYEAGVQLPASASISGSTHSRRIMLLGLGTAATILPRKSAWADDEPQQVPLTPPPPPGPGVTLVDDPVPSFQYAWVSGVPCNLRWVLQNPNCESRSGI